MSNLTIVDEAMFQNDRAPNCEKETLFIISSPVK